MNTKSTTSALASLFLASTTIADATTPQTGRWRAWLDTPGGDLPFAMELSNTENAYQAWIINGPERIHLPHVALTDNQLTFDLTHFGAEITCKVSSDGRHLEGAATKIKGPDITESLPFHATRGEAPRFPNPKSEGATTMTLPTPETLPAPVTLPARWRVNFADSDDPAVAIFDLLPDGVVHATIMTTTGDFRFLEGDYHNDELRLSVFDGAHAFLFKASRQPDGDLTGHFWSGAAYHDTFTATPDPNAILPDAFTQTHAADHLDFSSYTFPDLDGTPRSLADPAFDGKARILLITGSWCPNCHDASAYLTELHKKYAPQGLSIVALAFERTGDLTRDARQIRRYIGRHDIPFPILIAGTANKDEASSRLPFLDTLRSYPTTVFVTQTGHIHAVHTGFTGPATGDAYGALKAEFERLTRDLLDLD